MPTSRSGLGAVVLDEKIFAIGGSGNNGGALTTVEVYDPAIDSWTSGPSLPEPRVSMAVAIRDGKIYVMGGTDDWATKTEVSTSFVYDPAPGLWSTTTPVPPARWGCEVAVIGDFIYVVGGAGAPDTGTANEAYGFLPITTTTTITSDIPEPSQENQPFAVHFAVTSTEGTPTGIVTVTAVGELETCTAPLVNGVGNCAIKLGSQGTYTLIASYGGDAAYASSSDKEKHTVSFPKTYIPLLIK